MLMLSEIGSLVYREEDVEALKRDGKTQELLQDSDETEDELMDLACLRYSY